MNEGLKRRPIEQFIDFVGRINKQRRADREFKRKVWEVRKHGGNSEIPREVVLEEASVDGITIFIGPQIPPVRMPGDASSFHQISKDSFSGGYLVADIVHFSGGAVPQEFLFEQRTAQAIHQQAEVVRPQ